jgi:hypothetical protein
MVKSIVTSIFLILTLLSLTIIFLSTGYFLIVFIIVMPPAMILHFMAWYRSTKDKGHPALYGWVVLSSLIFLIFSLLRLDKDEHGAYNGYQTVAYYLGMMDSPHSEPLNYSLEMSLTLLLGMIILDAIILRKAMNK